MAQLTLSGDTSGSVGIVVPAVAGSNTATVPAQTGTLGMIAQGTAVATTSGTSITFTGIPSWAKQITVMFNGVSTSGTSNPQIQIGSGSVTTTGYLGSGSALTASTATANFTTGFGISSSSATNMIHGNLIISNVSGNIWAASGVFGGTGSAVAFITGGTITLSGTLDRVVLTTVNGTDTFDAGSVNILYQG